jgi:hypothetical protein
MDLQKEVEKLQATLTGNIFDDGEVHQKIYELKKIINPRIELHPEEDEDDECLSCGS